MQTTQRHLSDLISPKGLVSATAMPDLKSLVERYPYFHLARLTLLRLLYQQRDPEFNNELRRAALYLPSRETIFNSLEAEKLKPRVVEDVPMFGGAIISRKPNERLGTLVVEPEDNRTESLIDSFLNSISSQNAPANERPVAPQRRGRADASVDYISYMLQEEADTTPVVEEQKVVVSEEQDVPDETKTADVAAGGTSDLITKFIEKQGDRRIKLKDKKDGELQKPVLEVENSQQKGAFTETLARIYIKQGKFEHAIEIIQRLSLKYPKKNRYFADQIRFLEKIIANNKAASK